MQSSGARIDGYCLAIKRPDAGAHNDKFNGVTNVKMTVELPATACVNFGIGLRYSDRPVRAIPLLRFSYDNGVADAEQTVLWIGKNGSLFFATSEFAFTETTPHDPVPIEEATTITGAFVFTRWHYLEVSITLGAEDQSVVSVSIDGAPLLALEPAPALLRASRPLINRVGIINPMNAYFAGGYTMFIDDIYAGNNLGLQNKSMLGQQHIVKLGMGAASTAQWTPVNGPSNKVCVDKKLGDPDEFAMYVMATSAGVSDIYDFVALDTMYTTVNAVRIMTEQSIVVGTGTINIKAIDTTNSNFTVNVVASIPDDAAKYIGNALLETIGPRDLSVSVVNAAMFGYGV